MSATFNLFYWIWGRKPRRRPSNPPPGLSSDSAMRDPDSMSVSAGKGPRAWPNSKRAKRKQRHRPEERWIDTDHDAVLVHDAVIVLSDGECISDSESDASDWSVGWSEPHAPEFQSKTETEDSYAVLVPCYRRRRQAEQVESSKKHALVAIGRRDNDYLDHNVDIERWLAEHGSVGPIK